MAHDFNNQLTVIANYAYLAKMEGIENSTASHYLDQVISGTMRSADLTKSLLAFARKGKYTIKNLNMNTVIAEAVSIVKHSFAKNIEISQHLNADPSTISGDLNQLQNALINIALNSRDAMPGGGKLILSTETIQIDNSHPGVIAQDLSSGEHLKVCVRDTGNGMDPKTLSQIFEPFFTTKEKGTSLGMGMASVNGAVVSHHGFIDVCSTPGEGTSVTILFPTVALEPTEISAPNLKRSRGCGRILIVDDEEMVAASMKLILSAEGYELITYLNATDAIKNYEKSWRNIDLVLLDMIMPDLDGDEVYQAMRKINPDAKVLLLSGFNMTEKAKTALSEGARGFLQKPVITEELLHQIADTLGRAEATKPLPTTP